MKKFTLFIMLLIGCFTANTAVAEEGDVAVINVTADTYVHDSDANKGKNFGTETSLVVKNNSSAGNHRWTYLKFEIPANITPDNVGTAQLSLYVNSANSGIAEALPFDWVVYYVNDDSWTETGIKNTNKPSLGTVLARVSADATSGNNIRFTLTDAVKAELAKGDRTLSLCIFGSKAHAKSDASFHSKENGNAGYIPQLILSSDKEPEPEPVAGIIAAADAYVHDSDANKGVNFGSAETLVVKNNSSAGNHRWAYLKFIIPEDITEAEVGSARLSLYVSGANAEFPTGIKWIAYHVEDDSWTESGIKNSNKPAYRIFDELARVPAIATSGTNIQFILTDVVKKEITTGNRILSLCIFSDVSDAKGDASFHSKECKNNAYAPRLILSAEPDGELPEIGLLDEAISNSIIAKIRADRLNKLIETVEANLDTILPKHYKSNGSFGDINYKAQSKSNWEPLIHIARLTDMGLAYTNPLSKYYESDELYGKITQGYIYWLNLWPNNTINWFYNWIAHPRDLGLALIAVYPGKKKITDEYWFTSLIDKWRSDLGRPDYNGPEAVGANKCDISMQWIYRSCLSRNKADLQFAAEQGFIPVAFTTGEGIQHDYSFRQHGDQLYLAGYGFELMQLATRQAFYLNETPYAISSSKLEILSNYARKTYLKLIRGERLGYNVMGRRLTRTNRHERGTIPVFEMLKAIDTANATEYDDAIKRINRVTLASHNIQPSNTHYYRGEFSLHIRPEYYFDVRMASKRMLRNEYDLQENRQGIFLTDGATTVMTHGEEYMNTIPLWDWTKIPGITAPALKTMVRPDNYISSGRSNYAGGVSDGLHGVTAFDMFQNQRLYAYNHTSNSGDKDRQPALNFGAKKSWFMFDKEIVCLGAGIYSGHEEEVNTTVEQRRRGGIVTVSQDGAVSNQSMGVVDYTDLDWVLNDKIAYFFPEKHTVSVCNENRTGNWYALNTSFGTNREFSDNLFSVWFNHGVKPTNDTYAYIIVPNISSAAQAQAYNVKDIEILVNSDSVQAVYHKGLGIYGLAFYKAATFISRGLVVEADAGCVAMVKNVSSSGASVYVADPQKAGNSINLGIGLPGADEFKLVTYNGPTGAHAGRTLEFNVNSDSPAYTGKGALIDRSDWTIRTSYEGPEDSKVGGNIPEYIIDNDKNTAFLFVKPGKSMNDITPPENYIPSFTIDMKKDVQFDLFLYRHRTFENVTAALRAKNISLYGNSSDDDNFTLIKGNIELDPAIDEAKIALDNIVAYRYVKLVINDWDKNNGSTIQVSDFNIGKIITPEIPEGLGIRDNLFINQQLSVYPSLVRSGETIHVTSPNKTINKIRVIDQVGRVVFSTTNPYIETAGLASGLYFIHAFDSQSAIGVSKVVVRN